MAALSLSVHFDWRLAPYDLLQTRAHAGVLHRAGLLDDAEYDQVLAALDTLGSPGRRAARSSPPRTTRTSTPPSSAGCSSCSARSAASCAPGAAATTRWPPTCASTCATSRGRSPPRWSTSSLALTDQAEAHIHCPAPGFTHLQHAQPVSFGHELAKHAHAFGRDLDRLADWDVRAALSPLGAGALAGSALELDPQAVALELGFTGAIANSIDAVSDRDFVAEFLFVAAMVGVHLSRLGEEICLWASREFGWAVLDDAWSTGSSIMPQKKNPDIAELARGKSGRLIGNLTGLLATLKGLPFAYNRDLQEDKEPTFDAVETLLLVLPGDGRQRRDPALRHRADGRQRPRGVRAGHRDRRVAGAAAACRSATPMRSPGPACAPPRSAASSSGTSPTTSSRRSARPHARGARPAQRPGGGGCPFAVRRHRPDPGDRAAGGAAGAGGAVVAVGAGEPGPAAGLVGPGHGAAPSRATRPAADAAGSARPAQVGPDDVDLAQLLVDGPGGLRAAGQDPDVPGSHVAARCRRRTRSSPPGEHDEHLVGLRVGAHAGGVRPDAHLDPRRARHLGRPGPGIARHGLGGIAPAAQSRARGAAVDDARAGVAGECGHGPHAGMPAQHQPR